MSVNNTIFSLELVGLLPSTSYNCCVSAIYGSYTARGVCIETVAVQPPASQPSESPMMCAQPSENSTVKPGNISTIKPGETSVMQFSGSPTVKPAGLSTIKPIESPTIQLSTHQTQGSSFGRASSSADTIGGVLGFIIVVLLILLAVSGAALMYLLRPKFLRSVVPKLFVDRNSTDMPVRRNLSYETTPSHSTTSGFQPVQAVRAAGRNETDAAGDYSRIGPSYETIDSRKQPPVLTTAGRNQVSARLSGRYEFSEVHLAATAACGGGQSETCLDYEVPQNLSMVQIEENEEYSHLQH